MKQEEHLPIYGVGPFYGAGVIGTAVLGIILSLTGVLDSGKLRHPAAVWIFAGLGAAVTVLGFCVWIPAAFGQKGIDSYVKANRLCTGGVYRFVRNPCYAGITLIFTGGLLMAHNLWLLILPPLYWLSMTVLMKCSEEKWLAQRYGAEYREYCRRVNRCIPWIPRK